MVTKINENNEPELTPQELDEIAVQHDILSHLVGNPAVGRPPINTEDGMPLDFHDHGFMVDVYLDMCSLKQDIVGLKAAQVTFTTTAINAVIWIVRNKKINVIYTLPTFSDIRIMSGTKVNRIIAQNAIYEKWVNDKDTMEQKSIGSNLLHLRGTHSPKAATMVPSDLNVHDELDASNYEVVEQYATRLQHSDLKRTWWFSHPSVPGVGTDIKWKLSDQKHWFITCGACKKEQFLSFPESINTDVVGKEYYQCKECGAEITDDMRRYGRWVKKYKDRKISGYWIPMLIVPRTSAAEIMEYHRTKTADYFYNKVLGLPYLGGGNTVSQKTIYQNLTGEPNLQESRMIIGLDTGIDLRYVVGNQQGLFYYGQCSNYDPIRKMLDDNEKAILIADQGGDIIGVRELQSDYPGRVFLATYIEEDKSMQLVKFGENDETGRVIINRSKMIQLVVDEFGQKRIPLQYVDGPDDWYDYWLHFSHIYRTVDEDKRVKNKMIIRWHRSDRDDWVQATVYWRAGMTRFATKGSVHKNNLPKVEGTSYEVNPDMTTSVNPLAKVVRKTKEPSYDYPDDAYDWRR